MRLFKASGEDASGKSDAAGDSKTETDDKKAKN